MNLAERASRARAIVGTLASEGRGPKMSIPLHDEDEDVFLCDTLHGLEAGVERLTAERDGLAKALRLLVEDVQDYEAWQRPCHAVDVARATLAALPTPPEEDDR